MFDAMKTRYELRCPTTGSMVRIPLSGFRALRPLEGPHAPAVFRVEFDCTCGATHPALVSHDTLDYEPLATDTAATFVNILTGKTELLATEMTEIATMHIQRGSWPWQFYCYPEARLRPGFPSSIRVVSPVEASRSHRHGVVVSCAVCNRMTVNLVTQQHLDVPFHSDEVIHYVDRTIGDDRLTDVERFRHELNDGTFRTGWFEVA